MNALAFWFAHGDNSLEPQGVHRGGGKAQSLAATFANLGTPGVLAVKDLADEKYMRELRLVEACSGLAVLYSKP